MIRHALHQELHATLTTLTVAHEMHPAKSQPTIDMQRLHTQLVRTVRERRESRTYLLLHAVRSTAAMRSNSSALSPGQPLPPLPSSASSALSSPS